MEELLRELLSINREILSEIKLLRQELCREDSREFLIASDAAEDAPAEDAALAAKPRQAPPRYTPRDLEDIRGQLMEGLKKRNRDKSNAFSEFEKRHKDW